jgi:lipopolysaccharide heptosyltransferase II
MNTACTDTARWRWHTARNILAVRLDNLGDLLMTTPALAAIRCGLPGARITLLTSPSGAALAPHLSGVDEVIAFEAPWVRSPRPRGDMVLPMLGQGEARMIDRLAEASFDAAIIFTVCTQSALPAALLCRMAGIPLRLAHSRENPYELLTDWVLDTEVVGDGMRHEVERQLALVAAVGLHAQDERLRFTYASGDAWRLRDRLSAAGLDPYKPYFVVHVGATAASRRYPAERFGEAAEQIARESGCAAVFTGEVCERALTEQARSVMTQPSVSLAGELPLGELAALIAGAEVLVSNNTGPVHIAAAVATPVVDLYALTNPQHTPWKVSSRVLNHPVPCRNCLKSECPQGHHDCLAKVEPQAIVRASLELMGPGPAVPLHSAGVGGHARAMPAMRSQLAQAAP